jgi:hypothetical protein
MEHGSNGFNYGFFNLNYFIRSICPIRLIRVPLKVRDELSEIRLKDSNLSVFQSVAYSNILKSPSFLK